MYKRFLMCAALFVLCSSINIFAAEGKIINGRTLVPLRGAFEELGFGVEWNASSNEAVIKDNAHSVIVKKGNKSFTVDGNSRQSDVEPQLIDGRLYVPAAVIAESIGAATSWDSANKMVHISYNGKDSYINCKDNSTPRTYAPAATVELGTGLIVINSDGETHFFLLYDKVLNALNLTDIEYGRILKYNEENYIRIDKSFCSDNNVDVYSSYDSAKKLLHIKYGNTDSYVKMYVVYNANDYFPGTETKMILYPRRIDKEDENTIYYVFNVKEGKGREACDNIGAQLILDGYRDLGNDVYIKGNIYYTLAYYEEDGYDEFWVYYKKE